jgi:hypothetical protein
MSKWTTDSDELERLIRQALVVQESDSTDADAVDAIAHASHADPTEIQA